MKALIYNLVVVISISTVLGFFGSSCTTESPSDVPNIVVTEVTDIVIPAGSSNAFVVSVMLEDTNHNRSLVSNVFVDGLPSGVEASHSYHEFGTGPAGLYEPIIPHDIEITLTADANVPEGDYALVLRVIPADANDLGLEGSAVSQSFTLTITASGSSGCNLDLIGSYDGNSSCTGGAPLGGDVSLNQDANKVDIYSQMFDLGSTFYGNLDCTNEGITIPEQTVSGGGGSQQLSVEGTGFWVIGANETNLTLNLEISEVGNPAPAQNCQLDLTMQ